MSRPINVIGGGLAGVEAAFQIAERGLDVRLFEMRPDTATPAHATGRLGELVCSNSLGSLELTSASGLLKQELSELNSFFLHQANRHRVPAGRSLAVDRLRLAEAVDRRITGHPGIRVIRREVTDPASLERPLIIASGPLTSPDLSAALTKITRRKHLFFYDATSPVIRADSIDFSRTFRASRYGKGEADFVNIPLSQKQYEEFVHELVNGEVAPLRDFEKGLYFEACLPVEEIARRGLKALAFGTLKPVGLTPPEGSGQPHAVVQLRQDDLKENFYQLVGFQTRLKWSEQKRIFRRLPGLEEAEFERFGRMHRNTYINAPLILDGLLRSKDDARVFFAGQICGVEGYLESLATGLLAGIMASRTVLQQPLSAPPVETAVGSLLDYITRANWRQFTPTKFSFGLLPSIPPETFEKMGIPPRRVRKKQKKQLKSEIALTRLREWRDRDAI